MGVKSVSGGAKTVGAGGRLQKYLQLDHRKDKKKQNTSQQEHHHQQQHQRQKNHHHQPVSVGATEPSESTSTTSNTPTHLSSTTQSFRFNEQKDGHSSSEVFKSSGTPKTRVIARPNRSCSSSGRRALQLEIKRRSSMASVVLKSLSILLGIFFIFVGTTKLTPRVSKELYKDLRKEFARYAKVFPMAQTLDVKIPSKWYRRGVGALEILCGFCLTFVPSQRVKQAANMTLVLMMLFATFNHWRVGDKFERIAPSLVFFFMLTCRLIVEYQIKKKEKIAKDEKTDNPTTPLDQEQQELQPLIHQQKHQQNTSPSRKTQGIPGKEVRPSTGSIGRAKKDD